MPPHVLYTLPAWQVLELGGPVSLGPLALEATDGGADNRVPSVALRA